MEKTQRGVQGDSQGVGVAGVLEQRVDRLGCFVVFFGRGYDFIVPPAGFPKNGGEEGIRTRTVRVLSAAPPARWATSPRMVGAKGFEPLLYLV